MPQITVVAKRDGFYGSYRKAGDIFAIDDMHQFSARWMLKEASEEAKKFTAEAAARAAADSDAALMGERINAGGMTEMNSLLDQNRALQAKLDALNATGAASKAPTETAAAPVETSDEAAVVADGPTNGTSASPSGEVGAVDAPRQRTRRGNKG